VISRYLFEGCEGLIRFACRYLGDSIHHQCLPFIRSGIYAFLHTPLSPLVENQCTAQGHNPPSDVNGLPLSLGFIFAMHKRTWNEPFTCVPPSHCLSFVTRHYVQFFPRPPLRKPRHQELTNLGHIQREMCISNVFVVRQQCVSNGPSMRRHIEPGAVSVTGWH